MVRSKLEMKCIGDEKGRCKVFKKPVEGVKKKCHQLSLLCGVDIFFLCSTPEGEKEFSPHTRPPNKPDFLRILTRYRDRSNEERFKRATTLSANSSKESLRNLSRSNEERLKRATTLSANSSKESLRNLSYKISAKREEARRRLELLKGMGLVGEGALDRKNETQPTVDNSQIQRSHNTHLPNSCMDPFQQFQTGLGLPSDQLFWGKTQSSSSTDLRFKLIDGNMNGFGFNGSNSNNYCIHHAIEEFPQWLLPTCKSHKTISSTDQSSSLSCVDNYSPVPLMAPSPSPSLSSNMLPPPVSDFQPHTNSLLIGEFWGYDDYLVEQFHENGSLFFQ